MLLELDIGTRSPFLLQLIADTIGKRIGRAAGSEAGPALRAARPAACGTGNMTTDDLARMPPVDPWFEPNPGPKRTERLNPFRTLYRALAAMRQS